MSFPRLTHGQQYMGHFHEGQKVVKQHGFRGDMQHLHMLDQPSNEQLAYFLIHKPLTAISWDDATPVQHRIAASDIRKALAKLHQNPRNTVKDTLMSLKSDSARRLINALVQEQNEKLSESDSSVEWIIAGIDVQRETVKQWPSQKRIIRSIEVILKTEPTSFNARDLDDISLVPPPSRGSFDNGHAQMDQRHRGAHQHGQGMILPEPQVIRAPPPPPPLPLPPPPPMMNQPVQMHEHGGNTPVHMFQGFPTPPYHSQAHQHQSRGDHHNGQGGQHHVQGDHHQSTQYPGNGTQAVMIPPRPPHVGQDGPVKHSHVGLMAPFDPRQQSRPTPVSDGFLKILPAQQFVSPETIDPHLLKRQRAKSKSPRRGLQEVYELESESDSSSSDIDSQYSSKSVEDGAYRLIERSRSRGRDRSKVRSRGHATRSRSSGRERKPKVVKVKKGHAEAAYEEKSNTLSKDSSPRSSVSGLPTQQIFNIHIDNDNDRELAREPRNNRGRDAHAHAAGHDSRHVNKPVLASGCPSPIYTKQDKFSAHSMPRHSSIGGSDTGSSIIDGNSSIYTSDDSVFSEPLRPRMHSCIGSEVGGGAQLRSRNMPIPRHGDFVATYNAPPRAQTRHSEEDDYPHRRPRGSLNQGYTEPHRSNSFRQPALGNRHHDVHVSNPFDVRYLAQPSRSYIELPKKPYQQRYMVENRPDSFEFREMADRLDAMDYIDQSRRIGQAHRRNSVRGRMAPEVDEWAYRPRVRAYDGYR